MDAVKFHAFSVGLLYLNLLYKGFLRTSIKET